MQVEKGQIADIVAPKLDVRTPFGFRAPVAVWRKFLSPDPPPLYHDFFAMLMRVPEFVLEGDSLVAMQNARALHRMMNIMRETGAPMLTWPEFEPIVGRYLSTSISRAPRYRVIVEEAGQGIPLLCLHTAGADSRAVPPSAQRRRRSPSSFRVIAFDLPYHGRSTPPDGWWLKKYRLTTQSYLAMIRAVWLALGARAAGGDGLLDGRRDRAEAGGRISGRAARHCRAGKLGVCAGALQRVPASSGDPRRRACGELHLRALRAVESRSESRRENWWYYSQSGPGVYQGDVHFYSNDWDGREDVKRIDTNLCKVRC